MAKEVKNRVGELLEEVQRKTGKRYGQIELAEELGISETSLKNWKFNRATRFDGPAMVAFLEFFNKYLNRDITFNDLLVIQKASEDETSGQTSRAPAA